MAMLSGQDIVAHKTMFYQKIKRGGRELILFTIPFYLVRLHVDPADHVRGGNTFLQPRDFTERLLGYKEYGATVMRATFDELREADQLDLYLGEKPNNGEALMLHKFSWWPTE